MNKQNESNQQVTLLKESKRLTKVPRYLQIVTAPSDFQQVWGLRDKVYGKHYTGFSDSGNDDYDQNSCVLCSKNEKQVIESTGRIVFDSSEIGLPSDEYVKPYLDVLRNEGKVLAEPSKFGITSKAKGILHTYLLTFYEIGLELGVDALVFIIRDKNVGLYKNSVAAKVLDIGYSYGTSHRFSLLTCQIKEQLPYFFKALKEG